MAGGLDPGHVGPRGAVPMLGECLGLRVLNLGDDGTHRPAIPRIRAGGVEEQLIGLRVLGSTVNDGPGGICPLSGGRYEAGEPSGADHDDTHRREEPEVPTTKPHVHRSTAETLALSFPSSRSGFTTSPEGCQ